MHTTARAAASSVLATLLLLQTACTTDDAPDGGGAPASGSSDTSPAPGADESLREEALALVRAREEALVGGDREAFLATVDPDEPGFSATQARWFDNLAELPVDDISFELGDEDFMGQVAGEGDLQLPVDFTMRLRGFDRRPVTQRMVWTFVRDGDEVLLANDRNVQIEARTGWTPAPWDLTRIEVRRSGGVLAVFDEETEPYADSVVADLVEASRVVREHVPSWSGRFVAYDISDLDALDEMSAMVVEDTAGVAFPVLARPDGPLASFRMMVNPAHVGDAISRGVVFRHELVHVALGGTDGRSPTWLREGVAEHVGRSVLPLDARHRVAVAQLGGEQPRALEASGRFYTRGPARNYAFAALVCDYLATTRGEDVLWDLIRTFRTARFTSWAETEGIVRRELGLSTRELTARALAWAGAA